jgi:hypothetical protein
MLGTQKTLIDEFSLIKKKKRSTQAEGMQYTGIKMEGTSL